MRYHVKVSQQVVIASDTHKSTHTGAAPCRVPVCVIRPIRTTLEGLEDCCIIIIHTQIDIHHTQWQLTTVCVCVYEDTRL